VGSIRRRQLAGDGDERLVRRLWVCERRNCPYGNITMHDTSPSRVPKGGGNQAQANACRSLRRPAGAQLRDAVRMTGQTRGFR